MERMKWNGWKRWKSLELDDFSKSKNAGSIWLSSARRLGRLLLFPSTMFQCTLPFPCCSCSWSDCSQFKSASSSCWRNSGSTRLWSAFKRIMSASNKARSHLVLLRSPARLQVPLFRCGVFFGRTKWLQDPDVSLWRWCTWPWNWPSLWFGVRSRFWRSRTFHGSPLSVHW